MIKNKKVIPILGIHGWKGNKESFKSIAELFKIENADWIFPQAPYLVEKNKYSWSKETSKGKYEVKESIKYLNQFLQDSVLTKYKSKDINIIGFSQGAAICYEYILRLPFQFSGVYPISGFLRDQNIQEPLLHKKQKKTPIFIGHGKNDNIIPVKSSEKIYKILKKETKNVDIYLYNGGHKISFDYIKQARKRILNKVSEY